MTERNLESSVSQFLVKELDNLLSLLFDVLLSGLLEGDSENMLTSLVDSGSFSDDLSRDD